MIINKKVFNITMLEMLKYNIKIILLIIKVNKIIIKIFNYMFNQLLLEKIILLMNMMILIMFKHFIIQIIHLFKLIKPDAVRQLYV